MGAVKSDAPKEMTYMFMRETGSEHFVNPFKKRKHNVRFMECTEKVLLDDLYF